MSVFISTFVVRAGFDCLEVFDQDLVKLQEVNSA